MGSLSSMLSATAAKGLLLLDALSLVDPPAFWTKLASVNNNGVEGPIIGELTSEASILGEVFEECPSACFGLFKALQCGQ